MEGTNNYKVPPGFTNFAALTLPVAVYSHLSLPTDLAGAVIGGYVYRGPSVPRMDGIYFYGDFMAGWIWGLKRVGTNWQNIPILSPGIGAPHFMISTFGEDDQGQIYMADYYAGKIYQIQDSLQVWTPTFSPPSGTINSNTVTVSCMTTGAVIHFTSNGIDPTTSDPVVTSGGTVQVTTGITNKLRAFRSDLTASAVATAIFTDQVGTPVFSPPAGAVTNGTLVNISTITPGATVYYTTNGTTPTINSLLYTGPVVIFKGLTLKALGVESGYSNSVVATATYSIAPAATPVFSPASGPITNGTPITITCSTPGSMIYYTVDGSTPTTNSPVYFAPVIINGGTTLNAFAVAYAYAGSSVRSIYYQLVQTTTPVFSPASGPITNGTPITITCSTPGSTIYYTLDGSTPTTNSPAYFAPVIIDGGTTLNAYATASQHLDSSILSTFYKLVQTATPVFTPASGPLPSGANVSISCATLGSTIYYTLDGSTPTTSSLIYSNPVVIVSDTNLSAYSVTPGYLDSAVQSTLFTLTQVATPIFSPPPGLLTNGAFISISTTNSNATIRYTTDGSDPNGNPNAYVYTGPLPFTNPMTLFARAYETLFDPSAAQAGSYTLLDIKNTVVTTLAGGSTSGFSNAVGTLATFSNPEGVCVDNAGNVYVADSGNNVIRKILPSGQVTTFAGTGVAGSQLGATTNAQFSAPCSVCIDSAGSLYVACRGDSRVCKIGTNGMVTTLATVSTGNLWQVSVDSAGNVYVGSTGTVQRILPNGTVIGLAGVMNYTCSDGWCSYVGTGVDSSTNVYAATEFKIWETTPFNTTVLYAGPSGYSPGFTDGPRLKALFVGPEQVAFDSASNMIVSDQSRIRKISPDGWVSTMAGTGVSGYRNGRGSIARFNSAFGLCVDTNGSIYVADYGNNCIRQISPDTYGIGIPDWWQLAHFGYIGIDPKADSDHDGMSNYQEFWAGTDPLNASSVLAINPTSLVINGSVQIQWQTVAGKTYTIQYSSDLVSWNNIGNSVQGDGSIATVNDPALISQPGNRYYRVIILNF